MSVEHIRQKVFAAAATLPVRVPGRDDQHQTATPTGTLIGGTRAPARRLPWRAAKHSTGSDADSVRARGWVMSGGIGLAALTVLLVGLFTGGLGGSFTAPPSTPAVVVLPAVPAATPPTAAPKPAVKSAPPKATTHSGSTSTESHARRAPAENSYRSGARMAERMANSGSWSDFMPDGFGP